MDKMAGKRRTRNNHLLEGKILQEEYNFSNKIYTSFLRENKNQLQSKMFSTYSPEIDEEDHDQLTREI